MEAVPELVKMIEQGMLHITSNASRSRPNPTTRAANMYAALAAAM